MDRFRADLVVMSAAVFLACAAQKSPAADPKVSIRADFPGGNVSVAADDGAGVRLAPDLRGGDPWFYWYFEATVAEPATVTFTFSGSPMIGVNGPAVSLDEGKNWRWLGTDQVRYADTAKPPRERSESFHYTFTTDKPKIRFAVAIPYLPADLEAFLSTLNGNPYLTRSTLTRTRRGTPVDLLEIGSRGEGRKPILVTARHHACESMASYVLEGLIREATSESAFGRAFREKYRLFVVPMVDKDGVAAGDQGKNRSPHDHNRDYGDAPIYPEIRAIQELAARHDIRHALDLHCPALRGDVHEVFHFLGLGLPRVKNNIDEFIGRIREERPQSLNAPLNFLVDAKKPGAINRKIGSHYFATGQGNVTAATLEIPYAVPGGALDVDSARAYGKALLRAWTATTFVPDESTERSRGDAYADLTAVRTEFARSYRGKPDAMLKMIDELPATPPYAVESQNLRAALRLHQKDYEAARRHSEAALADGRATTQQTITARLTMLRVAIADPESTAERVSTRLNEFIAIPYLARPEQAQSLGAASEYFASRNDHETAINLARRQLGFAPGYDRGKIFLRIAALLDAAGKKELAVEARREAVRVLRTELSPQPPRSGAGGAMTVDLFDALSSLPAATLEEKRAAGNQALEHEIVPQAVKDRIRRALTDLEMP